MRNLKDVKGKVLAAGMRRLSHHWQASQLKHAWTTGHGKWPGGPPKYSPNQGTRLPRFTREDTEAQKTASEVGQVFTTGVLAQ
jgi:hypothetical protein